MIIEAVLLGIIIGLVRGGKISRLKYINLKGSFLFLLAIILHIGIIIMNLGVFEYNTNYYTIMLTSSYILILVGLIINIHSRYFILIISGLAINFVCFAANNFRFPINSNAVKLTYGNEFYQHLINNEIKFFIPLEEAKLSFLGNTIYINMPFVNDLIISIGDIVIALGIILFIQSVMSDRFIKGKGKLKFAKGMFKN